ncbi:hypothetical protein SDC9_145240 [bioreactor metagenome]|uniref:Uncharacterized protein n=1 Tax=bioreactor metagenome TaxID=1076179 RepID=A0A645E9H9_9ZZZZ
MGIALKGLGDVLRGDVGRHLAMQMSTHAVGEHHQQCVARIAVGDAVLVGLAFADAAFLIDGESHWGVLSPCR